MRFYITTDEGKHMRLRIPTALVLNRLTAAIMGSIFKKKGVPIGREHLLRLFQVLLECKSRYPDWVPVDVESADGNKFYLQL